MGRLVLDRDRPGVLLGAGAAIFAIGVVADLSPLRTLGRHPLLGYIASIELRYGFGSGPLRRALSLGAGLVAISGMIIVTWALSAMADRIAVARSRPPADAGGPVAAAP